MNPAGLSVVTYLSDGKPLNLLGSSFRNDQQQKFKDFQRLIILQGRQQHNNPDYLDGLIEVENMYSP